jgi:hypothetical protein
MGAQQSQRLKEVCLGVGENSKEEAQGQEALQLPG